MRANLRAVLFVLLVSALFVNGCAPGATPAGPTPAPPPSETPLPTVAGPKKLTIAQQAFPASLDPHSDITVTARNYYLLMFDALTRFDDQTLEVKPALAESWEPIDDTTWEFKLREGVSFHNGEPFNAEAVKFSFERIMDPETNSPNRGRASSIIGIEVVDDYTVRVRAQFVDPTVPLGLAWWLIIPPTYFQEMGEEGFAARPVGTGPFEFVNSVPEEYLTVKAYDDYWRGRAKIDEVTALNIPEATTRAAALQAGEADIVTQLPIDMVEDLEATEGVRIESVAFANGLLVQFDMTDPMEPLRDQRVRQALNYAVDKESINNHLFLGRGAVLDGQAVTKEAFGYCDEVEAYPYDPGRAKQLLAEAGYPDGFELTLHHPSGQYMADEEVAMVVAEQLRQVGVKVTLDRMEKGMWLDLLFKRTEIEGSRESMMVAWFSYGDAEFSLRHSSCSGTGELFQLWCNEQFTAALDAAKGSTDVDERQESYCDALQIMRDEAPAIFLVQFPVLIGVSQRAQLFQARPDQAVFIYPLDVSD